MAKIDKHVWCCVATDKWQAMDESEQNNFVAEHANTTLLRLIHMDEAADPEKELKRNYNIKGHYLLTNSQYGNNGCVEFLMKWSRAKGVAVLKREARTKPDTKVTGTERRNGN